MGKLSWCTATVSLMLAGAPLLGFSATETPKPLGLFSAAEGVVQVAPPQNTIGNRSRAVKINHSRLRSGSFFVDLPDGVSFEAVRDVQYDLGRGRSAWVGHARGNRRDRVVIGISGDALSATFSVGARLFKVEPRANGSHVVSEVQASDPAPELDPIPVVSADTAGGGVSEADVMTEADGSQIIDVMVAYTPRIASIYGTPGAEALIIQAMAETNQAYTNSGITARLNLVHIAPTNYTESGDINTDLFRLQSVNDGHMDELHALRDSYGADLVTLIEDEPKYCGIAYRMTNLSTHFASSAFSVIHSGCATGYYSFAHELGHNQGMHHDQANGSGSMYPYAYGYQDPLRSFRTVMGYNCSNGGCPRVAQFSNPDAVYGGQPTGISNNSDNTRTLNTNAATVASFRTAVSQPVPPVAPDSLNAISMSPTAVEISWADRSDDESGFTVERSLDAVSFSQIASLEANSPAYLDDNLAPDTLYHYRVKSWNGAGSSDFSNVASAATEAATSYTYHLALADGDTKGTRSGSYQDTWSADGQYETITEQQRVKRKTGEQISFLKHTWVFEVAPGDAAVFAALAQTEAGDDTFTFAYSTDSTLWVDMFTVNDSNSGELQFTLPTGISGTLYIRVKDNVRQVPAPTDFSVLVDYLVIRTENGAALPLPTAPTELTATVEGDTSISISWRDSSDSEAGVIVERETDGSGQWQQVGTTRANAVTFLDKDLAAGTLYHYRVNSFNSAGTSAYSEIVSAQTSAGAIEEIELTGKGFIRGQYRLVYLSWSGALGADVHVYRDGTQVATIPNSGAYRDAIGAKETGVSYNYQLCETDTPTCSSGSTVEF